MISFVITPGDILIGVLGGVVVLGYGLIWASELWERRRRR